MQRAWNSWGHWRRHAQGTNWLTSLLVSKETTKYSCLSKAPAISGKEKRKKKYNFGSHVQGHSWKSNYLSYKWEFKITKDKTWPSIKSLKSKIANQSQGREINRCSNGFWANLSFVLFVFKSIEYRKQQYIISSDGSGPKHRREKDIPCGDHYLKWPFWKHSFQLSGSEHFLK